LANNSYNFSYVLGRVVTSVHKLIAKPSILRPGFP
jgi:hypothetical protein